MTIGELIDKLSKYPNDWNVVISVYSEGEVDMFPPEIDDSQHYNKRVIFSPNYDEIDD